ncbi:MAG: hypothetical protein GXP29_07310 [Planctomycetes bacterium]|nr:hypothetical protein [Planctomycetota bacterium]
MKVRRLAELKRSQARLLERLREEPIVGIGEPPAPLAPAGSVVVGFGRVSAIVNADPQLGDHLIVARQQFVGQPPTVSDDATPPRVHYPGPGGQILDYAVDEFVLSCRVGGVAIALKLS